MKNKETKMKLNLDRLEITYELNEYAINVLQGDIIYFLEFDLIKNNSKDYNVCYDIILQDKRKFGEIYYGSSRNYKDKLYISVINEFLYNNEVVYLHYIDDSLNLSFHAINEIHLALDINKNIINNFYKLLANETYVPIILNKGYENMDEEIKELITICRGTRKKPLKYRTPYISNKEKRTYINDIR